MDGGHNLKNMNSHHENNPSSVSARYRVIQEKVAKKKANQDRHEQELQAIRDQNSNQRKSAEM